MEGMFSDFDICSHFSCVILLL